MSAKGGIMKGLVTLFLLLFSLPSFAGIFPNIGVDAYVQAPLVRAYSTESLFQAPYATPTDLCMLANTSGSGITIKVLHVRVLSTQTTAGVNGFWVVKRSTQDGAVSTTMTVVPHDSNLAASGADVLNFTAAMQTTGTLVGIIRGADVFTPPPASTTSGGIYDFDFGPGSGSAPLYLHNTEMIALNFQGVAVPSGMKYACEFNWTEE
jgi:hypothetical protein